MEVFSYLFCLGGGSSYEMLRHKSERRKPLGVHKYTKFQNRLSRPQRRRDTIIPFLKNGLLGHKSERRKPLGVLKLAHDYNIFQKRAVGTQIREKKALGCPKVVRKYICFP